MNTVHHVNYKGNNQRKIPSVFFREFWNCSLPNCTVNYCFLQTKSPTDWKVIGVIWQFFEKFRLNYRRKIHRRSISVGDFVDKLITNRMIVQILTGNSVSKYKDCGSNDRRKPIRVTNSVLMLARWWIISLKLDMERQESKVIINHESCPSIYSLNLCSPKTNVFDLSL